MTTIQKNTSIKKIDKFLDQLKIGDLLLFSDEVGSTANYIVTQVNEEQVLLETIKYVTDGKSLVGFLLGQEASKLIHHSTYKYYKDYFALEPNTKCGF